MLKVRSYRNNGKRRTRRTREEREAMEREALARAVNNQSLSNWPTIIDEFMKRGIPEADIRPRENVFTFMAWRALGRTVKRGEHGVKVVTWIEREAEPTPEDIANGTAPKPVRFPWTATVFHVSQTVALNGADAKAAGGAA